MPLETIPYDSADYLDSPEKVAAYVDAVLELEDPALFAHALGVVARARGMTDLAEESGLSRRGLYKALALDGDPRASTLFAVMKALGLQLSVRAIDPS